MQSIKTFFQSAKFAAGYSFRFVPKETLLLYFLAMLSGAAAYGGAFLLGRLVNIIVNGSKTGSYSLLLSSLILYSLVTALPQVLLNIRSYLSRRRWLKFSLETEMDILKKRELADIANYEDPKFQDLSQRAFRNGYNPVFQMSGAQVDFVMYFSAFVFGTILSIHFNYLVYIVVIVSAIPSFIISIKYAGKSWTIWTKDTPEQRRAIDLREHIVRRTSLIETKLLMSGDKILSWLKKILSDFAQLQISQERNRLLQSSVTDVIAYIGYAGGLFLVLKGVMSGTAEVGTVVYMIGTLTAVRVSLERVLETISGQYENNLIIRDMIEFLNTKPVIIQSKNPTPLDLKTAPEIVFENVSFKYKNSDKYSLKDLNLTFRAGDNIGLVGNNGAGKTTLVKLLCRIYDPTEGRILINGVDLKDVSTKEWWSYMAVMFQDYASYDFLVKDAIAISRPEKPTNLTKVVEASKISQSHDFIMEWKGKYDEQLGVEFKGKEPSKGQRQKLSIAKILYRDGFVMILDEPTASVDAESEAKIFDSIENLPKDRTAILISHDFSTISQCDKIFVLDKGTLKEEGDHKELMKQKGLYAELYNLQAKRFKK